VDDPIDLLYHMVLPVTSLAILQIAIFSRFMRASMLEVLHQDYIRTARAKGLSIEKVNYKHALRNAILPIITLVAIAIPQIVNGAIPNQLSVETTVQQERDLVQPGVKADEFGVAPELGFWRLAVIRFLHHRVATGALIILAIIVLSAVVFPIITGDLYRVQDYRHPFKPPFQSFQHLFGTDDLGRDELARLLRGARVSIMVGVLAVVGYLLIGGTPGALAGF